MFHHTFLLCAMKADLLAPGVSVHDHRPVGLGISEFAFLD